MLISSHALRNADSTTEMTDCIATNDSEIRSALHARYLRRAKSQPDTLVIDELGLAHAKCRVDIAVINGYIHGYEIKSAKDTLERLGSQISIYRQTLQKVTIVAAPKHSDTAQALLPDWCGLIEARQGPRRGIHFIRIRPARLNPEIMPVMMAHLLWRSEVTELLMQAGFTAKELRMPRKQLYEILCAQLTPHQITASIRAFMLKRQLWRGRQGQE